MSDHDLIVHSTGGSLAIRDGMITTAGPNIPGSATAEIDFGDALILPGWIDAHVHFNEPGRADWEGFATGSRALAAGGVTTFFDMPLNSSPPVITRAAFEEKRRLGENLSCLDFALWGGLTPDSLDHLEAMADAGAVGFKAFMCPSGLDEFQDANPTTLRNGMAIAASLDLPVAVHAEDPLVIRAHQLAHPATATDMRAWLDSRPISAELSAIRIAIELAGETGCDLHIVHVTCPEGIDLVTAAKKQGVRVTVETCPHYLLLDDSQAIAIGPAAKCAPPIRSRETVAALWQKLLTGEIDTLSSNVARRFRLPHKGSLTPGHHADFIVVEKHPFTITRDQLLTRHPISPYLGMTSAYQITATFVRGRDIRSAPRGQFIAPDRMR